MIAALVSAWPTVLTLLAVVAGVLFGIFKQQAANLAAAKAATADAERQNAVDKLDAVAAGQAAAQAVQTKIDGAAQGREEIDAQIAALPAGEAQKELLHDFHR